MRDISWFCDTNAECRYALDKPWVDSGYEYATNGRIMVRQPAPSKPDVSDGKKRPKHPGKDLFGTPASCTEAWPVPSGFKVEPLAEEATDTGYGITAIDLVIGGRLIAGHYVLLISLLGNVQYDPSGKPYEPLRFAADGIEGTVVPLSK